MRALLALEDGRIFEGESFGATGTRVGEICFNTSMTGYQEVLTDPSYRGQIVAMTYPHIGNYGTNALDQESARAPRARIRHRGIDRDAEQLAFGAIARGLSATLEYPRRAGDRHARADPAPARTRRDESVPDDGARSRKSEAIDEAVRGEGVIGMDYVKKSRRPASYQWDAGRSTPAPSGRSRSGNADEVPDQALPPVRHRIVAYDYGMKENILRRLRQAGFGVTVVPASTHGGGSARAETGWSFSLERAGRSGGARLRA